MWLFILCDFYWPHVASHRFFIWKSFLSWVPSRNIYQIIELLLKLNVCINAIYYKYLISNNIMNASLIWLINCPSFPSPVFLIFVWNLMLRRFFKKNINQFQVSQKSSWGQTVGWVGALFREWSAYNLRREKCL